MKIKLSTICCLLLACGTSFAQGVFEAPLSLSLGESAHLVAGIGYFRVTGSTVDYELAVYDLTAGSLSPVIATTSFESSFTTGLGQVITVSGCDFFPPNPFLPPPGPPGPITCPGETAVWGRFAAHSGHLGLSVWLRWRSPRRYLARSGAVIVRPVGWRVVVADPIQRREGGPTRRRTEWRPRDASWQFGSHRGAAIGELNRWAAGGSAREALPVAWSKDERMP